MDVFTDTNESAIFVSNLVNVNLQTNQHNLLNLRASLCPHSQH